MRLITASIIMNPPSSPTRRTMSVAPVGWSIRSASGWVCASVVTGDGVACVPAPAPSPPAGSPACPVHAARSAARTRPAATGRAGRVRRTAGVGMGARRRTAAPGSVGGRATIGHMARDLHRPLREAWIVDAVRTPIGRYGGALASVRPDDLAAVVLRAIVERTAIAPALVEDVILGCANQAGEDNRNVARMAALLAGLPVEVAGQTVNRLCGSGLQAINSAAQAIWADEGDVFIAGGVESMTRAPYVMLKPTAGYERGEHQLVDTTLGWRFVNPKLAAMHHPYSMGETAENVAERWGISRERQDDFALESQRRAAAAVDAGRFDDQLVPITIPQKKGDPLVVSRDEHLRPDTTAEALAKLRPAFAKDGGSVT